MGGYVLTEANYVNAFFSHDEYIDFFAKNSAHLAEIRETLGPMQQTGWHDRPNSFHEKAG